MEIDNTFIPNSQITDFNSSPANTLIPPLNIGSPEVVFGSLSADDLRSESNQIIFSGAGNDTVEADSNSQSNRIYTGSADDLIRAGSNERLFGGRGNDTLEAGDGLNNRLYAGAGDDRLLGGNGGNLLVGGADSDEFWLAVGELPTATEVNIVVDFLSGVDQLIIADVPGVDEFTDLNFVARDNGTLIQVGEQAVALLFGIEASSLSVADFSFTEVTPTNLGVEISPNNGAEMVNLTREAIVRFNSKIEPTTVNDESFYLIANGERIAGRIAVSSTGEFATFFYDEPLPAATEVRVVVEGDLILKLDGSAIDADGDGTAGGIVTADFRTLPLTRIEGTDVSGFVFDSYNRNPDGSNIPVVGATIRVDAFPDVTAVTDANGFFTLEDMPAPEFFVHIDGGTATNAPEGTVYATVGKPFHSVPGQATELTMDGERFDIYLPPMAVADIEQLSLTEETEVGFGTAAKEQLVDLFPDIEPSVWDLTKVIFPAGSAQDEEGNAATQAAIIPVAPDRLPGPLPFNLDPQLVISIQAGGPDGFSQAGGATNFDVPAPIVFPNLDELSPGEQSSIFSFNHDAGEWEIIGTGTVSADGLTIVSDPGVGILAPGWHFIQPNSPTGPNCSPNDPHNANVTPIPVISESGAGTSIGSLQNHLFFEDGNEYTIDIFNSAGYSSPCNVAPMNVVINVEGPAAQFIDGPLADGNETFALRPDEGKRVSVRMKELLTDQFLDEALSNSLFGVKITIDITYDAGLLLKSDEAYVYRLVDVSDREHEDGKLVFPKTLADGSEGVEQQSVLRLNMPESVIPQFDLDNIDDFREELFNRASQFLIFDPTQEIEPGESEILTSQLMLKTPDGLEVDRPIELEGKAIGQQLVFFPKDTFTDELRTIIDDNPTLEWESPNRTYSVQRFVQSFPDTDGDGKRASGVDEPFFLGVADSIYSSVVDRIHEIFFRLNPSVIPGNLPVVVRDSDSPIIGSDGNQVELETPEIDTSDFDCGREDALGCIRVLDFDSSSFVSNDFPNRNKLSWQEERLRLSELTNNTPDEDIALLLDRLVAFTDHPQASSLDPIVAFTRAFSNVFAHEIGHNLGAIHTFNIPRASSPGQPRTVGIMDNGNFSPNSTFLEMIPIVRLALGMPIQIDQHEAVWAEYGSRIGAEDSFQISFPPDAPLDLPDVPLLLTYGSTDENTLSPVSKVDLGTTLADGIGRETASFSLWLANLGGEDLTIESIELVDGDTGFAIEGINNLPITLEAPEFATESELEAARQIITIVFDPEVVGAANNILRIRSNADNDDVYDIPLQGLAIAPSGGLVVEVPNNNLGGLELDAAPITTSEFATLSNSGASPLTITEVVVDAESLGQFTVTGLPNTPITIDPGASIPLDLIFDAKQVGLQRGQISILSDAPDTPIFTLPIVGTGLAAPGTALDYGNDFVAARTPFRSNLATLRQMSDREGNWEFFLPAETTIEVTIFDPVSGLVAHETDVTEGSGIRTNLSTPVFLASTAPDSDGDGLPDDIEFAIGTSVDNPDTDGNGLDDFIEVTQGLDPFGGQAFPTGIIASLPLEGEAKALVIEGSTNEDQLAYIATGSHGLAIVDVSDFDNPIVLGQLELPGDATDVAVETTLGIAAIATNSDDGLQLVDISDPMLPTLRDSFNLNAQQVEIVDGIAYVVVGDSIVDNRLQAIDLFSRELLQELELPGSGTITALAHLGTQLYTFTSGSQTLAVIDIADAANAEVIGQLSDVPISDVVSIFATDNILYLGGAGVGRPNGLTTIDISNPTNPSVISEPDFFFDARSLALNGSGLIVIGSEIVDRGLGVYDISDPENTNEFLFSIPTSGVALDLEIASGIAYLASGERGLQVINYLSFDNLGLLPTANITSPVVDLEPDEAGIQVVAGSSVPIQVEVTDDVQVRQVELLVNDEVVSEDNSFPYEFEAIALTEDPTAVVNVQVRATDTGGNTALSNLLTFDLLPDTTPPTVEEVFPTVGTVAIEGSTLRVEVEFDEPMATSSLNPETLALRNASGTEFVPDNLQFRDGDRSVQLVYNALPDGEYELVIDTATVIDRAGNTVNVNDPVLTAFTILPQAEEFAGNLFPTPVFPTNGNGASNDLAVGDLNGDGNLDIVTANNGSTFFEPDLTISVLLGNDDGTFAPGVTYDILSATGGNPKLALDDLDGDGDLDVVAINSDRIFSLLNNGDGTLAEAVGIDSEQNRDLKLGDFNNDGQLDALVARNDNFETPFNGLTIAFGNGDGTFDNLTDFPLAGNSLLIAAGDLDGDNNLDLILPTSQRAPNGSFIAAIAVLLGDGTGGVRQQLEFVVSNPNSPEFPNVRASISHLLLTDVNDDGNLDILGTTSGTKGNFISLFLGNGDGTFGSQNDLATGRESRTLNVGDLNGDGNLDLFGFTEPEPSAPFRQPGGATVWLGNGDATFAPPLTTLMSSAIYEATASTLADFDNDGSLDLASVHLSNPFVSILFGNGEGAIAGQEQFVVPEIISNNFEFADLDEDGNLDVIASADERVVVHFGNGDGTLGDSIALDPEALFIARVETGDLDGDGHIDIVASVGSSSSLASVSIYLGNGDGTFTRSSSLDLTGEGVNASSFFELADLTGNGNLDLILSDFGELLVFSGRGDGSFDSIQRIPALANQSVHSLEIADFNDDGLPDLVLANNNRDNVTVLIAAGDGSYTEPREFSAGALVESLALADLNNDGILDLATANVFDDTISVLIGRGNGSFDPGVKYDVVNRPHGIAIGDLNGDLIPDLVATNSNRIVSIFIGRGDGTFAERIDYVSEFGKEIEIVDFDNDLDLDLLFGGKFFDSSAPVLSLLLNLRR